MSTTKHIVMNVDIKKFPVNEKFENKYYSEIDDSINYNLQDYSSIDNSNIEPFYKSQYNFRFSDLTPKKIALIGFTSLPFLIVFLLLFGLSVDYSEKELSIKYDNGSIAEVVILFTAGIGGIYYNQNDRKRKTRENMF